MSTPATTAPRGARKARGQRRGKARPSAESGIPDDQLSKLCKALGHPMRLRILRILIARQSCICGDLVDQLPLAQSTISQHLKVLKEAGLVIGEVDGPRRCYCVAPEALALLKEGIAAL